MKSVIKNKKEVKEKPFPKLMIHKENNLIVLFTEQMKGTVINEGSSKHKIGGYAENWAGEIFEHFDGTIKLSNS